MALKKKKIKIVKNIRKLLSFKNFVGLVKELTLENKVIELNSYHDQSKLTTLPIQGRWMVLSTLKN